VAAYRFGHTMIRDDYDFNINFNRGGEPAFPATLDLLFTFTALSGQLGEFDTLPDNWIIEWQHFVDTGAGAANKARRIDTKLAGGLFDLRDLQGNQQRPADAARLAVRNLLRGYGLRMPTGQAVAKHLHLKPLKAKEMETAAASPQQAKVLRDAAFLERTPLWYYLLAEAKHPDGGDGQRLGPVGSTIVAEVLIGLVRRSQDSILRTPGWTPSLPAAHPGRFELADLLQFARVLRADWAGHTSTPAAFGDKRVRSRNSLDGCRRPGRRPHICTLPRLDHSFRSGRSMPPTGSCRAAPAGPAKPRSGPEPAERPAPGRRWGLSTSASPSRRTRAPPLAQIRRPGRPARRPPQNSPSPR
jgi:hypothetical protein